MKYLCLDMAINTAYPVMPLQQVFPVNQCLFKNTDDEFIWDAAPWLFALDQQDFYTLVSDPLITFHHHLLIESAENIDFLREHLQQFIYRQQDNKTFYYRFWDARVLLKELPLYSEEKLNRFFNNYIQAIYIEDGHKDQLLKLSLNTRQLLNIEKISRSQVFAPVKHTEAAVAETAAPKTNYPDSTTSAPVKKRRFWTG
jgi:hypothetical protein